MGRKNKTDEITQKEAVQEIVRLKQTGGPLPDVSLHAMPVFEAGWVWLAGAGPGDPGLLTLHAVNALQQADVIIYDALVSEDILALARPDCVVHYAGKCGGKPSAKQQDISDRLVVLAKQGKRVLRLKGGDPLVFGRGGEEAMRLVEENIPFRIIPGITAGIAAAAYAGIPLTHRDNNHAVTFLTGHIAGDKASPHLDWAAIAHGSPVIVMYMAMKNLPVIAEKLQAAGRPATEPVAIITLATTARQVQVITDLQNMADDVVAHRLQPPAIIIIGANVALAEKLRWFFPQERQDDGS